MSETPSSTPVGSEATRRIGQGYDTPSPVVTIGSVIVEGTCDPSALVGIPLSMFTRHGLVAGATGTGKTRTLQLLAEQLSAAGVPVMMSDIKGDLSGLATAASSNDKIVERAHDTGDDWQPAAFRVEFFALAGQGPGIPVRASIDSFEKGAPTPVAWTRVRAPRSLMAPSPADTVTTAIAASPLQAQYGRALDRDSAYEMLARRLAAANGPASAPPRLCPLLRRLRDRVRTAGRTRRRPPICHPRTTCRRRRSRVARSPTEACSAGSWDRTPGSRSCGRWAPRSVEPWSATCWGLANAGADAGEHPPVNVR